MDGAEIETSGTDPGDADAENDRRPARSRSEVVRAPAQGFRGVLMDDEADD